MADQLVTAIAGGSSVVEELERHHINPVTFYRWEALNEDFANKLAEAYAARERLAKERLWKLSRSESDKNANGRRTAAHLIEKALAFQIGGMNSQRSRPRHEIEHQPEEQMQVPIVQINFGRPDKPPGWKVTDDFPELGDVTNKDDRKPTVIDAQAIQKQKGGFIGEE